ncbi:uncharacterized protein, partial [Apostichopus japonicus]|uniref:uncharacterized protein n=1 Tax=Stichopus japonicus TaxID=307972 RepID=UPI003AB37126
TAEINRNRFVKAEVFLPIQDVNGFVYKNVYCARCNGVNESSILATVVRHFCMDICPVSMEIGPEHRVKMNDENCQLYTQFTSTSPRPCQIGLADDCPMLYEDSDIREKCRNYISPVVYGNTYFRNPHCAYCHPNIPIAFCIGLFAAVEDNHDFQLTDLFGSPWLLGFGYRIQTTTVPPELPGSKLISLVQCPNLYTTTVLLAIRIANGGNSSTWCPYLNKRIEICIRGEMSRIRDNLFDYTLPWQQLRHISVDQPFELLDMLYFHVPEEVIQFHVWEMYMFEFVNFLLLSKEQCQFEDIQIIRLCGNVTQFEETLVCKNLYRSLSPEIMAEQNIDGNISILDPVTLQPLGDFSWFRFIYQFENSSELRTIETQVCGSDRQKNTTVTMVTPTTSEKTNIVSTIRRNERYSSYELIFSSICVAASILSLIFTFFTYCAFSELRNSFGLTLMNFCFALACGQILIHFVTDYVTGWNTVCLIVAMVTHFMWLATFAWMNLLAWNLKSTFSKPKLNSARRYSRNQVIGYFCYGWVLPSVIVGVCGCLFFYFSTEIPITYGLVGDHTCWIGNGWVVVGTVGGPLVTAIIFNAVFFILIVRGIRMSRFTPDEESSRQRARRNKHLELLVYVKISILMGFSWSVGFFIAFDSSRILFYAFFIAQALQGILIMVFFAFNERVRKMWKMKLGAVSRISLISSSHTRTTTM